MATQKTTRQRRPFQDLTGQRFGQWQVIEQAPASRHGVYWKCRCGCGVVRSVQTNHLTSGASKSCGCSYATRGRVSHTREFRIWVKMLDRCYNPRVDNFRYYGERGVRVCARWKTDPHAFLSDMGTSPSTLHTLDRIDTFGNYSCGKCEECQANGWTANCRWATPEEQHSNNRKKRLFTHDGKTLTLKQWAAFLGVSYHTLFNRIYTLGWDATLAIATPIVVCKRNRRALSR